MAVTETDLVVGGFDQRDGRLETRVLRRLAAAVIVTDAHGIVVYWNDQATAIYGFRPDHAIGRPITELNVAPAGFDIAETMMRSAVAGGKWEGDFDARRADGAVVPIHLCLERVDEDDIGFHGIVGTSIDVSDRRELEASLAFQALHDPVTGLPNRRRLVDLVENALLRTARTGRRTAVLSIDIDDFKGVNDRIGHVASDQVLRAVGERISCVLRTGDGVARFGGDEFVVCCDDLNDPAEVYAITDRISRTIAVPLHVGAHTVTLTSSIGVALSGRDSRAEGLVRNAYRAMLAAKLGGKARVELFDDESHEQLRRRHDLARELEHALEVGDVKTFFQPQIALDTGILVGFEALARWSHPTRGPISPDEFIAVAEESGIIGRLGQQVLRDATTALAAWLDKGPERPLKVAVNVSPRQLADPEFPEVVRGILDEAHVPPGSVCLELTESALADADIAATALRNLKAIGVEIAIDDFGTGYSSLSRLHRFPLDYLKIDRGFVAGMTERDEDVVIIAAVLGLARALGLRTIGEGIEHSSQLEQLIPMGCDLGQGYLWSPAVSYDEALRLVTSGKAFHRASPAVTLS